MAQLFMSARQDTLPPVLRGALRQQISAGGLGIGHLILSVYQQKSTISIDYPTIGNRREERFHATQQLHDTLTRVLLALKNSQRKERQQCIKESFWDSYLRCLHSVHP